MLAPNEGVHERPLVPKHLTTEGPLDQNQVEHVSGRSPSISCIRQERLDPSELVFTPAVRSAPFVRLRDLTAPEQNPSACTSARVSRIYNDGYRALGLRHVRMVVSQGARRDPLAMIWV